MASEPFPCEQIHDPEFEQLVGRICLHPTMYVTPATFAAVCGYLSGFNAARSGGPLVGLKQWLVVRRNGGNNLSWSGLAWEQLAISEKGQAADEQVICALGQLLKEFFEYRRTKGITKVFHEYARWLLRKSWYTGPLRRGSETSDEPLTT